MTSNRRKFRSQTSDNMERWKAEMGRVREEKRRRKKIKEEKFRRKKIQVREKVGKSRFTVFFQWFVGCGAMWPDERWKVARRCGAKPCAKHMSKSKCTKHLSFGALLEVLLSEKCAPLWREAHVEVKVYKTHHVWTTFGSWDVEKVHAVCGSKSTC